MNTVLVLYAYCEQQIGKHSNSLSKDNLLYFLNNGIVNDERFQFVVNISGKHTIDLELYQKKFFNLKFLNINGLNAYSSWMNIINNTTKTYDNYIFMKDKIRGPYNLNFIDENHIITNWIDYLLINSEKDSCIVMGLGTSPFGKLSKFPYIPDKFFMISNKCFNLILKQDLFTKLIYDTVENGNSNNHIFDTLPEIILSKFFLENNINYYSLDVKKKHYYKILDLYKNKQHKKLLSLNEKLHIKNDISICNRIFWSGQIMKDIFDKKIEKTIKKIKKKRCIKNLSYW